MATIIAPITITIRLQAPAVTGAGFGNVLILVDQDAGNTLNGDRFRSYSSALDSASDQSAGYITSDTQALIDLCFTQSPAPSTVLVGRVDTDGGETYPEALTACILAGASFYGVAIDSLSAPVQVAVATAIGAMDGYIFAFVSSDADWYTTGIPTAYATIEKSEKVAAHYHDAPSTSGGRTDIAWLAAWLNIANPDDLSSPGSVQVLGITPIAATLSASQAGFILENGANYIGLFGTILTRVFSGQMMSGRQAHERLSADWLNARLSEAITNVMASQLTMGRKLPISTRGQALIIGAAEEVLDQGVAAQHFTSSAEGGDDYTFDGLAITTADINAERLRFNGSAMFLSTANYVSISLDLYRS